MKLYTVQQVADILGCSPRNVRGLLERQTLKGTRLPREWYVLHKDLKTYLKSTGKMQLLNTVDGSNI